MNRKNDNQLICKLYQSGMSTREIADRVGTDRTMVNRILRNCGVPPRPRDKIRVPFDLVCKLYESGMSIPEIARKVNIHQDVLYPACRKHGMKMKYKNPYRKFDWNMDEIRRLYEIERRSIPSIAKSIGCACGTLYSLLKKCGIQVRSKYRSGIDSPSWKGGIHVTDRGYVYKKQPDHPHAGRGGYVRLHRLVMEEKIGRYLERHEVVHHIDGNPGNNDPSNLELFSSNAEHLSRTKGQQATHRDSSSNKKHSGSLRSSRPNAPK